ncbi:hypothetical protein [Paenibacillus sp. MBLB4367]|uniref:hypothetical protein n=1 Tax=Paenibacillus sp. MBLB4367 TaxID=3384767 RepID=UPI00390832D0
MSCHPKPHCPTCPTKTVYDPPVQVFRDIYHPQVVEIVHQVEIVNRHHCCPVPRHVYTSRTVDDFSGMNNPYLRTERSASSNPRYGR